MQKLILSVLLSSLWAWGMDYQTFKTYTLKHSPLLQSKRVELDKTRVSNAISLRAKNPILTLEGSRYDQNSGPKEYEYAVGLSQTVRTPWYMQGIKQRTAATSALSNALVTQGRAGYLKELESLYTEYVFQSRMLDLLKQEYALSQKVTNMVKERYKNGSETKVAYLQARTQRLTLKTQLYTARQQQSTLYYQLIAISGLTKRVSLEKRFIYPVSTHIPKGKGRSPQQLIIDAKKKLYQSQMALNGNSWREVDLFSSLEREPDQSIIRVGVNIPLSINNDRSEERMLAKLQMHQAALDSRQLAHTLKARRSMLETTIRELSGQYHALERLSKDQQELVSLLEEGYRIAKGSLFQLMTEKSKLIQTRKTLLQTYKTINLQKIELRFLQGDYNE